MPRFTRAREIHLTLSHFLTAIVAGIFTTLAAFGSPGLNGPVAINPFLNHKLPPVEPTGANEWAVQETFTGININLPMHLLPYPGTSKLLCVAKEGKTCYSNTLRVPPRRIRSWTLSSVVFTSSDCGTTWLVFHPEFGQAGSSNRGYVYIGIGDEGGSNDQFNDGQKINDRLFSGILRIDVNQKATSHAIRRQPLHHPAMPAGWPESFTANYRIPARNSTS